MASKEVESLREHYEKKDWGLFAAPRCFEAWVKNFDAVDDADLINHHAPETEEYHLYDETWLPLATVDEVVFGEGESKDGAALELAWWWTKGRGRGFLDCRREQEWVGALRFAFVHGNWESIGISQAKWSASVRGVTWLEEKFGDWEFARGAVKGSSEKKTWWRRLQEKVDGWQMERDMRKIERRLASKF
jgi:hypothetical protein